MSLHKAVPGQVAAGHSIGMLCAEWNIPFIPGDLNNASTFDFPILYATVPGADGATILSGDPEVHQQKFVDAALALEAQGVKAITSNCGYMAAYQQAISEAVNIPVFMSSLLQTPLLLTMLGSGAELGILVAGDSLRPELLRSSGLPHEHATRVVVKGLAAYPHWNAAINQETGELDSCAIRDEVLDAACGLAREHPNVRALLLECSDLPPYAHAVAEATGLPVFDWSGFIRWVHQACSPKTYPQAF
ncbi:aspartate/glutamate racemase family protein [Paenarthrobacter nicotinovorans]|uniref:aspartate/glutamate racemase family protein n=1 Tax=Paenarthrobacter nicotinovorans TaxID=29320 RepID=UPI00382B74A7